MLGQLLPPDLYSTLKSDFHALYEYSRAKKIAMPTNGVDETNVDLEAFNQTVEAATAYTKLEQRTYKAVYHILAAISMTVGALLAAKMILPILSFKFCLGLAVAVGAFVVGHDIFNMATAREGLAEHAMSNSTNYRNFLWSRYPAAALDQLTENTLLRPLWRAILPSTDSAN